MHWSSPFAIAMAAVIPEKVHFEPGSEAVRVSEELSKEPSLLSAPLKNYKACVIHGRLLEFLQLNGCNLRQA